jgi:hypothetical protein
MSSNVLRLCSRSTLLVQNFAAVLAPHMAAGGLIVGNGMTGLPRRAIRASATSDAGADPARDGRTADVRG